MGAQLHKGMQRPRQAEHLPPVDSCRIKVLVLLLNATMPGTLWGVWIWVCRLIGYYVSAGTRQGSREERGGGVGRKAEGDQHRGRVGVGRGHQEVYATPWRLGVWL